MHKVQKTVGASVPDHMDGRILITVSLDVLTNYKLTEDCQQHQTMTSGR